MLKIEFTFTPNSYCESNDRGCSGSCFLISVGAADGDLESTYSVQDDKQSALQDKFKTKLTLVVGLGLEEAHPILLTFVKVLLSFSKPTKKIFQ